MFRFRFIWGCFEVILEVRFYVDSFEYFDWLKMIVFIFRVLVYMNVLVFVVILCLFLFKYFLRYF